MFIGNKKCRIYAACGVSQTPSYNLRKWGKYVFYLFPFPEKRLLMAISDKRKESMYNYAKKNLKRIPLDVQKEKYEEIKAAATAAGESVNGYIKKAVDQRMDRDNA
ncbi:MAG: hypothetical protein V8R17_11270 [Blautia obeum]